MAVSFTLLGILIYLTSQSSGMPTISPEKRLCADLMSNYSQYGLNGRPIVNVSQAVNVTLGLGLINMDIDEKEKILTTSMWSKYVWTDEYLQWNPADYEGVNNIKIWAKDIWKPDIMLYNTAETDPAERQVLAVLNNRGEVLWVPHQIFKSACSIDVTNYPFDTQICSMWFGSWTYTLPELDLQLLYPSIDLRTFESDYKSSCAWDIVNSTGERFLQPKHDPSYVSLSYTLIMRRKMVFSTYILTLPCIFLACLTLVVFWLPPDRPDRTSLAMSIFSSFLLLLLILVEAAPRTASSVPSLGLYYCFNMVIIMLSVFFSTLVVNICRGGDSLQPVPKCIRLVFIDCVAYYLRLGAWKSYNHQEKLDGDFTKETQATPMLSYNYWNAKACSSESQSNNTTNGSSKNYFTKYESTHPEPQEEDEGIPLSTVLDSDPSTFKKEIHKIRSTLKHMSSAVTFQILKERNRRCIIREWRLLATVFDRLFFLIYLIAIVVSLIMMFPRPPGVGEL